MGDRIETTLYLDDVGRRGFDLYYLLRCGEREIARVKTGLAFFDYEQRKIAACPERFIEKFQGFKE
jgi:acyl-CoA thioesterase FadM